ncbi:hypothetical protein THICB2_590126 [Thiomonas sp. CB2]|nr:hypothetical protein THICB2_590126 [Thiomonas sp. CB2]
MTSPGPRPSGRDSYRVQNGRSAPPHDRAELQSGTIDTPKIDGLMELVPSIAIRLSIAIDGTSLLNPKTKSRGNLSPAN